ncbi:thrB [Symbiodinium natans]|uniref:ThrB protein n=1 Tax=Symbiodinium natans TaxID=878477 RepID=A0A812S6R6_9DINO|nr:thrB [Symbiodinium natans]
MSAAYGSPGNGLMPEVVSFAQKYGLATPAQEELQKLMHASVALAQRRVTVSVPATVANLGPGLETVGLAVDIWDEFTLEFSDHFNVELRGSDVAEVPRTEANLVVQGAAAAFKVAGRPFPPMRFICEHRIPVNKGLGAASASFVGGFLAASVLSAEESKQLPRTEQELVRVRSGTFADGVPCETSNVDALLQATIARGWNPGNVCPAIYGALQIGIPTSSGTRSHRVPIPNGLVLCLFVPDAKEEGKSLDVDTVERRNAIFNVGRSALLINCFATQDFAKFQKASEDFLAMPTILEKFPHIRAVSQAALTAGASGACACGYGPAVMALIQGRTGDVLAQSASNQLEQDVAKAMLTAGEECLVNGQILIAKPVDVGAHVVAEKSTLGPSDERSRIVYFQ